MKHKIEKSGLTEAVGYGTRHGPSARGKPAVRGKPTIVKLQLYSCLAIKKTNILIPFCNRNMGLFTQNLA